MCRFSTLWLLVLAIGQTAIADPPGSNDLEPESTQIYSADGSKNVGTLICDRSRVSGKVKSLFYSGPPGIVVRQVEPWTHWHSHSELAEIHFALTSLDRRIVAYLGNIRSLKTLRIEDSFFADGAAEQLGVLSRLENLEIDFANGHRIEDWSFLERMPGLKTLSVVGEVVPRDFGAHLSGLRSLKSIEFWVDDKTKYDVLPKLSGLPSIESMQITRVH